MTLLKVKKRLLVCVLAGWIPLQVWSEAVDSERPSVDAGTAENIESVVDSGSESDAEMGESSERKSSLVEESPVPDAYVARALFTTEVVDREPVDQVVSVDEGATQVMFFTDLRNLQGRTVTHRWEFEGSVISEVDINVKGPRWRAYSVKSLNPGEVGKWTVFVIDESGWPLHASILQQRVSGD
ncbi:MAG: DUF2914 domain-containing protein [Candidatus Thiodiazotropha sp.]